MGENFTQSRSRDIYGLNAVMLLRTLEIRVVLKIPSNKYSGLMEILELIPKDVQYGVQHVKIALQSL